MQYPEIVYKNIPNEKLLLISMLSIKRNQEECTFERLVKECFTLFPKNFSFSRYPEWPDSIKLDRPLRDLRLKRLITGNNQSTFDFTITGEKYAVEVEKQLLRTSSVGKIKITVGRKEKRIFDDIKNSKEYKTFISESESAISNDNLKVLFFGTLETPNHIVQRNIENLIRLSEDADEEDLIKFLNYCKEKLNDR